MYILSNKFASGQAKSQVIIYHRAALGFVQLKTTLVVDTPIPGLKHVLVPGKTVFHKILFSVTVVVMIQLKQNSPTKAYKS